MEMYQNAHQSIALVKLYEICFDVNLIRWGVRPQSSKNVRLGDLTTMFVYITLKLIIRLNIHRIESHSKDFLKNI